jgi:ribose transport system ATP-binding protein
MADAPVALEVRDVRGRWLRGVDLTLRKGEILGLAGLVSAGVFELPYAIAGHSANRLRGELRIPRTSSDWIDISAARGLPIPIVPADRLNEAVVSEFTVRENLSLAALGRFGSKIKLDRRAEHDLAELWLQRLSVTTAGTDAPMTTLSGGNQQKVVIARCLATDPEILVLCEPTAGVDIGTRIAVYQFLVAAARRGLSLIVASSDVGDLIAICNRVLVLRGGRLTDELAGARITEGAIVHAATGGDAI